MADLITLARAQMVPSLASADAAYLAELISAASTMVIKYCNRDFNSTVYTEEEYDGEGTSVLLLNQFPIITLTSVITVLDDGTEDTCLGAQFRIDSDLGEIRPTPDCDCTYSWFLAGYRNIKVTYTAGYATVPADVQEATAQEVAYLFANASTAANVDSWKLGDAAVAYNTTTAATQLLAPVVRQLLGPYRNVSI